MLASPSVPVLVRTVLILSLAARCNGQCVRPLTTTGYDLTGVVETALTQGALFDVTGVACSTASGYVAAAGTEPTATTCTEDGTAYTLSGCAEAAQCSSIACAAGWIADTSATTARCGGTVCDSSSSDNELCCNPAPTADSGSCGKFQFSCSELTSDVLWGEDLEAQVKKIGLAALVGAIIGLQREFGYAFKKLCSTERATGEQRILRRLKGAAGLRTHMLTSIASCLFTIVSQHGFTKSVPYSAGAGSGDPARITAQIVSGVGFLGAGTIVKGSDGQLCGLTTATTIWTAAALGICAGSDSLDDRLCIIAVAIVVACLQVSFNVHFAFPAFCVCSQPRFLALGCCISQLSLCVDCSWLLCWRTGLIPIYQAMQCQKGRLGSHSILRQPKWKPGSKMLSIALTQR